MNRALDSEPCSTSSDRDSVVPLDGSRLSPYALRAMAVVALLATFVGRTLAPALPGSRAGIGAWIAASDRAAAFLTQLALISGVLLGLRLVMATLRERDRSVVYRLVAVPTGAVVVTLSMAASAHTLDPEIAVALAFATGGLAVASGALALRSPRTRAAGLVLALTGVSAITHLVATMLAIRASEQALTSLFFNARIVATIAYVLDFAVVILVAVWLALRDLRRSSVTVIALLVIAMLIGWGALRGSSHDATTWQVIAARSLGELVRHPLPLVAPLLRYFAEACALFVAAAGVFSRRRPDALPAALSLAVLARGSVDLPLLALLLALSALAIPLCTKTSKN